MSLCYEIYSSFYRVKNQIPGAVYLAFHKLGAFLNKPNTESLALSVSLIKLHGLAKSS